MFRPARSGQVALQCRSAHKGHHRAGGVAGAAAVPGVDRFLKELAQHFRVNGYFGVQGRGLGHHEIVAVEQAVGGQEGFYDVVADDDALLIQVVALEQAAVEVGRLADDLVNALAALLRGRVHAVVKQGVQPLGVEAV